MQGSLAERLFAGTSEVARLMRTTNWAETPLGPSESWPHSLQTAVSICLGSRHPMVLMWGPELRMFYNDDYRGILGKKRHPQFLGAPVRECWPELWDTIGPMMERVMATGEATWSEDLFLLMTRSGYREETYATFSLGPIRDEVGTPRGIFSACQETTARVVGERRMKTLREIDVEAKAASEAAEHCAAILGKNPRDIPFNLVYLVDDTGKNLQLRGQAGLRPGAPASPLEVPIADGDAGVDAGAWPLARVMAHGAPELVEQLTERFDGLPREPWGEPPHQAMLLPVARPGSRTPAGVLVLGVSPRRAFDDSYEVFFGLAANHVATAVSVARAYQVERERAEKLAEVDRARTAFFTDVSHEFRTPLTLILGPIEDALAHPNKVLSGERLEVVHRSALRLLRLVNSLLEFTRIEAGRVQSTFTRTDLSVMTAALASAFQVLVDSAGLRLVIDCPALDQPVYVDRSHWEKIVFNLVLNAFNFTFEGEIAIRLRNRDGRAELSVSDTGIGIPADEISRIFERFHRVEGARGRNSEGTGIGLALVHELVKAHGGHMHVESALGRGTTFVVSLPLGVDHLPEDRIVPEDGAPAHGATFASIARASTPWVEPRTAASDGGIEGSPAPAEAAKPSRILVADDNPDMQAHLARMLCPYWDIEVVGDGRAALASALACPPALVLSDVMMPHLDGVALLRALRQDARTGSIPIVLLTARAGEDAVLEGVETGADDYLVKPFSARELLARVRTHMRLSQVRKEAAENARLLAESRARREALQQAAEAVARTQRLHALGQMAAGVSHDLRNLLNPLVLHLELADHGIEHGDSAGARDHITQMKQLLTHSVQTIERLRDYGKQAAESRLEEVDLDRLIREATKIARPRMGEPGRSRTRFAEELGAPSRFWGHAEDILSALVNLIVNAIDALTGDGTITLRSWEDAEARWVQVTDDGPGMAPEVERRVFEPFFTTKGETGTGLGLAMVDACMQRHGGAVKLETAPGQGTRITLVFPRRSDRPADRPAGQDAPPGT